MPDQEDDEQPLGPFSLEDNGRGVALADEGDDRPTIGQRMAGMGPRPAPAPVDVPAPPVQTAALDMSKLPPGLAPPSPLTVNNIPTPPADPALSDLAKQQAQFGKPIDPNTRDASGKSIYKQGAGTKVIGSVGNFLSGFGRSNRPPVYVGPGATNARYSRDVAQQQGNLANVNTQIGTREKLDTQNNKMFEDLLKQAYQGDVGEARLGTARAQQETADVKKQLADMKESAPPVNKIGDVATQRTALADQQGLKGQARTDYILTGKLPKEFTDPNAPKRGSKFDFDKIERDKEKAMKDAEGRANVSITKLSKPPGPLDPEFTEYIGNPAAWKEGKKQEIYAQLEKEKAQAQSDYESRIQEKGGTISSGTVQPKTTAKPSAAASKIDPKNLPKTVMVGGKPRRVVGYNQQTKKVQVAPEGE